MQSRLVGAFPSRWLALILATWAVTSPASAADFQTVAKQAARNNETTDGTAYMDKCAELVGKQMATAMDVCGASFPDSDEPVLIAFVVARDGQVSQRMASPKPFAQCVLSHLPDKITLPRPPRDDWAIAVGVENHHHSVASKRSGSAKDVLQGYDAAIEPYVAEGKATYPSAKKRFLAGLKPGEKFLVRVRLRQANKIEESFVDVRSIKDGKITGIVNSVEIVTNYRRGQQLTISENEIKDWVIQHANGSEEGNAVGRFLNQNRR